MYIAFTAKACYLLSWFNEMIENLWSLACVLCYLQVDQESLMLSCNSLKNAHDNFRACKCPHDQQRKKSSFKDPS